MTYFHNATSELGARAATMVDFFEMTTVAADPFFETTEFADCG